MLEFVVYIETNFSFFPDKGFFSVHNIRIYSSTKFYLCVYLVP